jgi:hypothetical protein
MDKEEFNEMIKEYLKEHLQINIEITDPPYRDEIVVNANVLLDGEIICNGSDSMSYSMIGKNSYSDDY